MDSTAVVAPSPSVVAVAARGLVKSAGAVGEHSWSPEECAAFARALNHHLGGHDALRAGGYIPLPPDDPQALFGRLQDGVLLCVLVNLATPSTIDERVINWPSGGKSSTFAARENANLAINSARSIGARVVNVHASDVLAAPSSPHLVLGLVWQLLRIALLARVSLRAHPEVTALLTPDETAADLLALPPEALLLRWANFLLARDGAPMRLANFGPDVADGRAYVHLLHAIDAASFARAAAPWGGGPPERLDGVPPLERAKAALAAARALGVPVALAPGDVTAGNRRLNLAFVAEMFNCGLALPPEVGAAAPPPELVGEDVDGADSREERTFTIWLNSLGLVCGGGGGSGAGGGGGEVLVVHSLTADLRDGVILLAAVERLAPPGTVDWKRATADRARVTRFRAVENCNLAVALCRDRLGFSLAGVGGVDVASGNRKLLLALVWQLMRYHVLRTLETVGGGTRVKEEDLVAWANATAAAAAVGGGTGAGGGGGKGTPASTAAASAPPRIGSLRDPALATGGFLAALLGGLSPGCVNPALLAPGDTPQARLQNAKYLLSVARKLGATVFLGPEDVVDATPKMMTVLLASLKAVHAAKTMASSGSGGGAGTGGSGTPVAAPAPPGSDVLAASPALRASAATAASAATTTTRTAPSAAGGGRRGSS